MIRDWDSAKWFGFPPENQSYKAKIGDTVQKSEWQGKNWRYGRAGPRNLNRIARNSRPNEILVFLQKGASKPFWIQLIHTHIFLAHALPGPKGSLKNSFCRLPSEAQNDVLSKTWTPNILENAGGGSKVFSQNGSQKRKQLSDVLQRSGMLDRRARTSTNAEEHIRNKHPQETEVKESERRTEARERQRSLCGRKVWVCPFLRNINTATTVPRKITKEDKKEKKEKQQSKNRNEKAQKSV